MEDASPAANETKTLNRLPPAFLSSVIIAVLPSRSSSIGRATSNTYHLRGNKEALAGSDLVRAAHMRPMETCRRGDVRLFGASGRIRGSRLEGSQSSKTPFAHWRAVSPCWVDCENLTLDSRAVVRFYDKCGTAEQWIPGGDSREDDDSASSVDRARRDGFTCSRASGAQGLGDGLTRDQTRCLIICPLTDEESDPFGVSD